MRRRLVTASVDLHTLLLFFAFGGKSCGLCPRLCSQVMHRLGRVTLQEFRNDPSALIAFLAEAPNLFMDVPLDVLVHLLVVMKGMRSPDWVRARYLVVKCMAGVTSTGTLCSPQLETLWYTPVLHDFNCLKTKELLWQIMVDTASDLDFLVQYLTKNSKFFFDCVEDVMFSTRLSSVACLRRTCWPQMVIARVTRTLASCFSLTPHCNTTAGNVLACPKLVLNKKVLQAVVEELNKKFPGCDNRFFYNAELVFFRELVFYCMDWQRTMLQKVIAAWRVFTIELPLDFVDMVLQSPQVSAFLKVLYLCNRQGDDAMLKNIVVDMRREMTQLGTHVAECNRQYAYFVAVSDGNLHRRFPWLRLELAPKLHVLSDVQLGQVSPMIFPSVKDTRRARKDAWSVNRQAWLAALVL